MKFSEYPVNELILADILRLMHWDDKIIIADDKYLNILWHQKNGKVKDLMDLGGALGNKAHELCGRTVSSIDVSSDNIYIIAVKSKNLSNPAFYKV